MPSLPFVETKALLKIANFLPEEGEGRIGGREDGSMVLLIDYRGWNMGKRWEK